MGQPNTDSSTLAVPEILTVVERKQLTTFLAAAQGHFQGTDAALQEFEGKLKSLQRLPDEWKVIDKEWQDLKLSIRRNEENSSALLSAANQAHQAAIVAGDQIAVLTERIQSLDTQVKRTVRILSPMERELRIS